MVAQEAFERLVRIPGSVRRDLSICPTSDQRAGVLGRAYQELEAISQWWTTTEGDVRKTGRCLFRQVLDKVDELQLAASACAEVIPIAEADLPFVNIRTHGRDCPCVRAWGD